jgi:hypothetical protein
VVGRPAALLGGRLAAAALVAALAAYYALFDQLPRMPLWADVVVVAAALIPATFALVWLALPLRAWRGVLPVGIALAVLAAVWQVADVGIAANFAKLGAATAIAFWFLSYFERLSWVVAVAAVIPLVDAVSVWRGPTHHIVTEQPEVFTALSYATPVPGDVFALGLPDILFFTLFLAAAARWGLRVAATWVLLLVSLAATIALAVWTDPFGIGGLPALPGLSIAFLLANADLIWRRLRERDDDVAEEVDAPGGG